jgi:hypothetical protein
MKRNLHFALVATVVLTLPLSNICVAQSLRLPTWTGSFVSSGAQYTFTMVGTDPSLTNQTTTIPVFLIPIKVEFDPSLCAVCPCTYDPETQLGNGQTVVQNVLSSPIFNANIDFVQGGTNLGYSQYIDAFQRGNFWQYAQVNTQYHLNLGTPTVLSEQTIQVTQSLYGTTTNSSEWGGCIGTLDVGFLNQQLLNIMSSLPQITPGSLPVFLTYEAAVEGSGGLHYSLSSGQTYIFHGYNSYSSCGQNPCYSQDVSILAHEVAEWADDPFGKNVPPNCETKLEVGDPYFEPQYYCSYNVGGFTYHLQDLAFLPWFGHSPATSHRLQWFQLG